MIRVSQGHEKGIGTEVFLKSFIRAPKQIQKSCLFYTYKKTLERNLRTLKIDYEFGTDLVSINNKKLFLRFLTPSKQTQSTESLCAALDDIKLNPRSVLFTLPTSKTELFNPKNKNKPSTGYTEFLRTYFKTPELGMFFCAPGYCTLLMSDHIPLKDVSKVLTQKYLHRKMSLCLKTLKTIEPQLRHVWIAGINPHAGEGGVLGTEDRRLSAMLPLIKKEFDQLKFHGPLSGDTLHFHHKNDKDLMVYMYHDQGLASFKSLHLTLGANITLGLPFIRLSVDHGTAFEIYGKNKADERGALFCLKKAYSYLGQKSGIYSSLESKST